MLAVDLLGIDFEVSDATFSPGAAVPVTWQLANQGFDTAWSQFDLHFFLSRDAVITTGDLFAGTRTWPAGFPLRCHQSPGGYHLPAPQFPRDWNGSGTYYLGMIVDPNNYVYESDEFNNFNRGIGLDVDYLQISTGPIQTQPDLMGTSLTVNTANPQPGGPLSVSFGVTNGGGQSAGPFQVSLFLSSDAHITAGDRLMGTSSSSGLAAGTGLTNSTSFTLPPAGDAIYSGGGDIFVGMIVDSVNAVQESNELNNSNRGLGNDLASVHISDTVDPDSLPPTGVSAGTWLHSYLVALKEEVQDASVTYKDLRSAAKGITTLPNLQSSLSKLSRAVARFDHKLAPLVSGKVSQVKLRAEVLDRTQLELIDRVIAYSRDPIRCRGCQQCPSTSRGAGPVTPMAAGVPNSEPTLGDKFDKFLHDKVNEYVIKPLTDFVDRQTSKISNLGKSIGNFLSNALHLSVGTKQAVEAVSPGGQQTYDPLKQKLQEEAQAERDRFNDQQQQFERSLGLAAKDTTAEDLQQYAAALDQVDTLYDTIATRLQGQRMVGSFKGTSRSLVTCSNGSTQTSEGEMEIVFSNKSSNRFGAALGGHIKFTFFVEGRPVGFTRGYFGGTFRDATTFSGKIELHAPTGAKAEFDFSWKIQGAVAESPQEFLSLSGDVYDNSVDVVCREEVRLSRTRFGWVFNRGGEQVRHVGWQRRGACSRRPPVGTSFASARQRETLASAGIADGRGGRLASVADQKRESQPRQKSRSEKTSESSSPGGSCGAAISSSAVAGGGDAARRGAFLAGDGAALAQPAVRLRPAAAAGAAAGGDSAGTRNCPASIRCCQCRSISSLIPEARSMAVEASMPTPGSEALMFSRPLAE